MARAIRHLPRNNVDGAADVGLGSSVGSAHFLIPALQTFAQKQRQQRQQNGAAEDSLPSPTTFSAFIERAHATFALSRGEFHQLRQQQSNANAMAEEGATDRPTRVANSAPHRASVEENVQLELDDDSSTTATSLQPLPTSERSADESREQLAAAVRAYNPSLQAPLLQRIASRLAIADTLFLAKQLARYLHDAAAAEDGSSGGGGVFLKAGVDAKTSITTAKAMELLRRAVDACRVRHANPAPAAGRADVLSASTSLWALSNAARESAGIALSFHHAAASLSTHGQRRRRPRLRCFFRYVSDVQVSEVLPNGAVVVFTQPTHPAAVGDRAAATHVHGEGEDEGGATTSDATRRKKHRSRKPVSFRESLESCLASSPVEVHLHCVLYRRGVSLAAAVARVIDAAEGRIQREDVHVNLVVPENDEHVVVQLCSVLVAIPVALRGKGSTEREEAVQHCLHVARALAHVNLASDGRGEDYEPTVGLQLLYGRPHSCAGERRGGTSTEPASAAPQLQYAVLLRGFDQRGGPADQLDRTALRCSETIPNFFSPHHFGPAAVPFVRTYHVTAALEKGRYAEAAAMMLCLWCGTEPPQPSSSSTAQALAPWLEQALHFLCSGEEREGAWQAWWMQHVPAAEQVRLLSAKAELVWNVLASCRLQELAAATNGRGDALMAASPEPGDFVRCATAAVTDEKEGGAEERFVVHALLPHPTRVTPIYTQPQAARYTVHDIVLPVVCDAANGTTGCESLAEVEAHLGFTAARRCRRRPHEQPPLSFRPLLVSATGYPRAARPWTRSFPEPSSGAALDRTPTVFHLATDWTLASSSRPERDYAATSRGPRAQVWPLSKRGRALSDRLPAGLLSVASANGSSLLGNETALSRRHASRCLAVHCTLPADVSLSNYLCEFATVEDLRQSL
ncbi:putative mitochondrial hypothetical protein [Leptomonas pyrrhocoris]|uniref:Uncharacterized protein n=1 Tax=Leptomonas pyrrhocoris TaxID=157538 RepID=A0A0M9G2Z8_LEPPY|nr:putative mitochondrial hypothetical protein [Leptomonas pyrrhocoris]KPA81177.1 putative mitochondrial hypothetical protein [Leptomonas pyrrhocoris]|eukprot:XP_015659616.1 putative mitochondrial hypothetical protein [Leptomonas pyrrhocoris]